MVETIIQKRSSRAEREFGLIVGGVLALLSLWWLYRGKFPSVSHITILLGPALVLLGLLIPQVLVLPNKAWMALAEALAFVSTRIILAFVFFGVVTPIGLVKRWSGWDPLSRRSAPRDSYWKPYTERQRDPRHYEKMF